MGYTLESNPDLKVAGKAHSKFDIWNKYVNIKIAPEKAIEIGHREGVLLTYPKTEIEIELKPVDSLGTKYPVPANLIITDNNTGVELIAIPFKMIIKDYIFDHISRPLLHTIVAWSSFVVGIALLVLEIITILHPNLTISIGGISLITFAAILKRIKNQKYIDLSKNFVSP